MNKVMKGSARFNAKGVSIWKEKVEGHGATGEN